VGRLASFQVPAITPPIGKELPHLLHTPSSSASRARAGRRSALGADDDGDPSKMVTSSITPPYRDGTVEVQATKALSTLAKAQFNGS
jgi:hypothetical protein